jgi:hypothetical protein
MPERETDRSLYTDRVALSLYVAIITLLVLWATTEQTTRYIFGGQMLLAIAVVLVAYVALRPLAPRLGPSAPSVFRRTAIGTCIAIVAGFCFVAYLISAGL